MKNLSPRFVMLHGVAGAGKSSLAEDLSAVLIDQGAKIDLIPEEAIFTRNEFAEVGQGFKTGAWPTAEVMLAAYYHIIEPARLHKRWVIADWNCVGMIEDLPWAQPDRAAVTTFQPDARAETMYPILILQKEAAGKYAPGLVLTSKGKHKAGQP